MTDTHTAWAEVTDHLSALCLKLKLHAEEELSDDDLRDKTGFDRLAATIDETMDAIGDAYDDDAVRADAREAGRAFVHALDVTFRNVRDRMHVSR